jgi:hypothetical protein
MRVEGEARLARPWMILEAPTRHYYENEAVSFVMLPGEGVRFKVDVRPSARVTVKGNRAVIGAGLRPGRYTARARFKKGFFARWSEASPPVSFEMHARGADLGALREADHRLEAMVERGADGTVTLTDPVALPAGALGARPMKWFNTPSFEGATKLLNEDADYYADPLAYYLACIDELREKGVGFVTWHDLLEGKPLPAPTSVLLQFDIDGGPRSMERIWRALRGRDVRATIMTHRRGHCWYPYELESAGLDWLRDAQAAGWAIGYHNNALSQCVGESGTVAYDEALLQRGREVFAADVRELRRHFEIRTFTHHGGNVFNNRLGSPVAGLAGVDRPVSPALWRQVKSAFSDGGFVSRPGTLREKVRGLDPGLHFFRNHPFKYANYEAPHDVGPRGSSDADVHKERRWLEQRQSTRASVRAAYPRLSTPVSERFRPWADVRESVGKLRARRSASFTRLYPSAEHDPRVFWWRMLDAWVPKRGEVLNVGALPPDQKDENAAFLGPQVVVREMDIDAARQPDYLGDIVEAPPEMNARFDAVLLFGLPYFARPSAAVEACLRLTRPGGVALFGFGADTHPARGALWHRARRPVWRRDAEPLREIGLKANLWSFDAEAVDRLFSGARKEFMGHYWFVVCEKHG